MADHKLFPVEETIFIGIPLALVGGFLDAYSYLLKGGVFANAETGNIVLMGVQFMRGNLWQALYYLFPICAFFLGGIVVEATKEKVPKIVFLRWTHLVLVIEIISLLVIGFLPPVVPFAVSNVTISFVCSLQVCTFRTITGAPYATTMCTGNLRSCSECFYRFWRKRDPVAGKKALRYFVVIATFCLGALLGAVLASFWAEKSIWVCCGILFLVFLIILWFDRKEKRIRIQTEFF